ncbi:hypothetical protein NOR51B_2404 [Luminiphilus syltensis NOR5-1B]|uniref:Uncharacterized protein n=1 Tax=Luminiphilus syltensis NOR5-1B TaxID=565045 RepID=B8KT94_9GAMM|nr:hypothetical protein NOR51B_2404 [Luminiphilus syltensis NOR5-1B]
MVALSRFPRSIDGFFLSPNSIRRHAQSAHDHRVKTPTDALCVTRYACCN